MQIHIRVATLVLATVLFAGSACALAGPPPAAYTDGKTHSFKIKGITLGASLSSFRKDPGFRCSVPSWSKVGAFCAPVMENENWKKFGKENIIYALLAFSSSERLVGITVGMPTWLQNLSPNEYRTAYSALAEALMNSHGTPTSTAQTEVARASSLHDRRGTRKLVNTTTWEAGSETMRIVDGEDVAHGPIHKYLACRNSTKPWECANYQNLVTMHILDVEAYATLMEALQEEANQQNKQKSDQNKKDI